MRTAFFGGSFNPPHVGHVMAASYALSVGFEQVFVPVVKDHAFSKDLIPFEHRVQMTKLAFAPLRSVIVSRLEERLQSPSFTLHTLRAVKQLHPDWDLHLMVGGDVVAELPNWHEPQQVLSLAPLFALGRLGHPVSGAPPAVLPEISSREARARLAGSADDRTWLSQYVPKCVLDYVAQQGLYR